MQHVDVKGWTGVILAIIAGLTTLPLLIQIVAGIGGLFLIWLSIKSKQLEIRKHKIDLEKLKQNDKSL